MTSRVPDPDRELRRLGLSKPDPQVGRLDRYVMPIINAPFPAQPVAPFTLDTFEAVREPLLDSMKVRP